MICAGKNKAGVGAMFSDIADFLRISTEGNGKYVWGQALFAGAYLPATVGYVDTRFTPPAPKHAKIDLNRARNAFFRPKPDGGSAIPVKGRAQA